MNFMCLFLLWFSSHLFSQKFRQLNCTSPHRAMPSFCHLPNQKPEILGKQKPPKVQIAEPHVILLINISYVKRTAAFRERHSTRELDEWPGPFIHVSSWCHPYEDHIQPDGLGNLCVWSECSCLHASFRRVVVFLRAMVVDAKIAGMEDFVEILVYEESFEQQMEMDSDDLIIWIMIIEMNSKHKAGYVLNYFTSSAPN
uniref:Uncharacterized protein n=1 Tax=Glossina austeni TaxID=7395 RepID=A0A1A9UGH4_GLOAU